jgi:hypothetical protein
MGVNFISFLPNIQKTISSSKEESVHTATTQRKA